MRKKVIVGVIGTIAIVCLAIFAGRSWIERQFFRPTDSSVQKGIDKDAAGNDINVVAERLEVPWEVIELPDGDLLVTERPGTVSRIGKEDRRAHQIAGVRHIGEGGLLGLALHPDFQQNRQLYVFLTTERGGQLINRIERYRYENDNLSDRQVILDEIPGARNHDGGRIAFGPDGKLYATTGDAGRPDLAQDRTSLAGKILRLNDDGSIPEDNPFNSVVYSYGHRNPQGIAWDDEGRLWSTEHGRSGAASGYDELNLIRRGGNYGWPAIQGDETADGMIRPVVHSGADETWAPAGLAYHSGSLFFTGLRGETLYEAKIVSADSVNLSAHFRGQYGRLRAVTAGNDVLYVSTSNQDGRGTAEERDDIILAIKRSLFK